MNYIYAPNSGDCLRSCLVDAQPDHVSHKIDEYVPVQSLYYVPVLWEDGVQKTNRTFLFTLGFAT